MLSIDDRVAFASKVALFLGVLAIGVSLGASWGLIELQQSCIQAGKLPTPGTSLTIVNLDESACWQGAKRMQLLANTSVFSGAVLALGGGLLDHYGDRVREVTGWTQP